MKVILLQDIPTLGKKNDTKEVSNGYARNFLLPRNLAIPATADALQAVVVSKEREVREKSEEYQKHKALAERLAVITLKFVVKVGEKGRAFGSVTATKIRDALKKEGIAVEKEWVLLEDPIKVIGEHLVKIKFPPDFSGTVKVTVAAEE